MKPVLSGHSKIDEKKVLKPCGRLMQVKIIAECSPCNTFDLYLAIISLETPHLVFLRVAAYDRFYCMINIQAGIILLN